MRIVDGGCAPVKVLMAVTASALVMWAIASPKAADDVRWRTVVGIVHAANLVGNAHGGDDAGRSRQRGFVRRSSGV